MMKKDCSKIAQPHPQKTYEEDFFEKFPNAPRQKDGTPLVCWGEIYGTGGCEDDFDEITCAECWTELI